MKKISLAEPNIVDKEWLYLQECLNTGWVSSSGSFVKRFEESVSKITEVKHSTAVVNGTSALHLSLLILGIKEGDEVLVPSLTFIAPINAIRYLGASPVFLDCNEHHTLDITKTLDFLENETRMNGKICYNKKSKRKITAILPVHTWGNPVEVSKLKKICRSKHIKIIEDASESLGSLYSNTKGTLVHTGMISDMACLSFNGNKIVTSGGGGMILTNYKTYSKLAKYYSTQAKDDPFYYKHNAIGFNYRLTNIQAALGLAQIEYLSDFQKKKKTIYDLYREGFKDIPGLEILLPPENTKPNYWMTVLRVNKKIFGFSRDHIIKRLLNKGVQCRPVWYPNHLQKPFRNFQSYRVTRTQQEVKKCICLPSSTHLLKDEVEGIVSIINKMRK